MALIEVSRQHFCTFGFNGKAFNRREKMSDQFWVNYDPCQRTSSDWKNECLRAAQDIEDRAGSDLRVCLSGGKDSEIVAESFRQSQISFKAVIMRMSHGLNQHDIDWAFRYCEKHSIEYDIIEIDAIEFIPRDGGRRFKN